MGLETTCRGVGTAGSGEGRLLLETDELIFRGPARVRIPLASITRVVADDGELRVAYPGGSMSFHLGPKASSWADRIRFPKSRIEKMGVRAGDLVSVIGVRDQQLDRELAEIGARVSRGRVGKASNAIIVAVETLTELDRLDDLKSKLDPAGGIWVVHRKGKGGVKDVEIFAAGKRAGLTANKVVRFSDTHTAEKLVIPKSLR